jgi:hypothetical protein
MPDDDVSANGRGPRMSNGAAVGQGKGSGGKALSVLTHASGVLLAALLLGAIYMFAGTIQAHGLKGAALIYDIYSKGLPGCL